MIKDWRRRGGALVSSPCGTLGVDVDVIDLSLGEHLFRESASGRSEPSKR
jgi:hypothetical protein